MMNSRHRLVTAAGLSHQITADIQHSILILILRESLLREYVERPLIGTRPGKLLCS